MPHLDRLEDAPLLSTGSYQSLKVLHVGRFSTVYLGKDVDSETRVALKALDITGRYSDVAFSMFRKEVDSLEGFQHSRVVQLLDHFASDDQKQLVIALELVPNAQTLRKFIRDVSEGRTSKPSLAWRVQQLLELFDAIDLCHGRRIIHRDINLNNVLVGEEAGDRSLKLIDFGIAKVLEHYEQTRAGRTLQEFHTPPFAAPEQSRFQKTSLFSDYYAFGLVAASFLTFRLPQDDFTADHLPKFLEPLKNEVADSEVFQSLSSLLKRALEEDPYLRPRSVEFRRVLERVQARITYRPRVGLTLQPGVTSNLQAKGWKPEAIYADLNAAPVGRYEQSADKGESLVIYGEKLVIRVVEDASSGGLRAVWGNQKRERTHQRERAERTARVYHEFVKGGSGAEGLFENLHGAYLEHKTQDDLAEKRSAYFKTSSVIMRYLFDETKEVSIHYRLLNGQSAKGKGNRRFHQGEVIRIKVLDLSTPGNDILTAFDGWAGDLTQKLSFSIKHLGRNKPVGVFQSFDSASRVLELKAERHLELPVQNFLNGRDIATLVNLSRQQAALDAFIAGRSSNPQLDQLLLEPNTNTLGERKARALFDRRLKGSFELIERILSTQGIFALQGPPGTGKTTHITEVVGQILKENPKAKVLVASQANEAVNNACDKLAVTNRDNQLNWRLARDVSSSRQLAGYDEFEVAYRTWAQGVRAKSEQVQARFERSADPERAHSVREALVAWREGLTNLPDVRQAYKRSAQIHGATLLRVPALMRELEIDVFDWVIIDEAAKANDTEVLIPLVVGKKFLLVGDHKQLPPFIKPELEEHLCELGITDYNTTLFERLYRDIAPDCRDRLLVNYRMHSSIAAFISTLYYDGELVTGAGVDARRTIDLPGLDQAQRIFWFNVSGKEFYRGTSSYNPDEVNAIQRSLLGFNHLLNLSGTCYTVGVITPYAAQRDELEHIVKPRHPKWTNLKIEIATTHAFQGKDKELVFYSLVQTDPKRMKFVEDERLLNVAFSRPERALLIFGHREMASQNAQLERAIKLIKNVVKV